MSNANVIRDTSATLKALLEERLNAMVNVTVDSPHRGNQGELRVNLFLYSVVQDEGRRSSGGWIPAERSATTQRFFAEPLALRLSYLVTAFAGDGLVEHELLGEAMQVFYRNRRVPEAELKGTLQAGPVRAEHLELVLLNLDIDALQKIWGSQNEPPRTSVAYEVSAVFLDAQEADAQVRLVEERRIGLVPFPSPTAVSPVAARAGDVVRLYGSGLDVAQPGTGRNLVRVRFADREAEVVPGGGSPGALRVRVPDALPPGAAPITVQLDRFVSAAIGFDVLEGA